MMMLWIGLSDWLVYIADEKSIVTRIEYLYQLDQAMPFGVSKL